MIGRVMRSARYATPKNQSPKSLSEWICEDGNRCIRLLRREDRLPVATVALGVSAVEAGPQHLSW